MGAKSLVAIGTDACLVSGCPIPSPANKNTLDRWIVLEEQRNSVDKILMALKAAPLPEVTFGRIHKCHHANDMVIGGYLKFASELALRLGRRCFAINISIVCEKHPLSINTAGEIALAGPLTEPTQ